MTKERRMKLIYRWALLAGGLSALVWTICYFITGSVPVIGETPYPSVSRWWDILMGPICSTLWIVVSTPEDDYVDPTQFAFCVVGFDAGLSLGLLAGIACGFFYGLIIGLLLGFALGLVIVLIIALFRLVKITIESSKDAREKCKDWLTARDNTPPTIA